MYNMNVLAFPSSSPKSQSKATKASTNFIRREPLKHEKPRSSAVSISPSLVRKSHGSSRKDAVKTKDTAMHPSGRVKEERPSLPRGSKDRSSEQDKRKKDEKPRGGAQGQSPAHKTSTPIKGPSGQSKTTVKGPSYSAGPTDPTAGQKGHRSEGVGKGSEHAIKGTERGSKAGQSSNAEKGSDKKVTVRENPPPPPHSPPEIEEDLPEDTHPQPMMEVEDGYSYDEDFEVSLVK